MDKLRLTTLGNGLRLITSPMPQVGSVTVVVAVGAGSRHETKDVGGLFHFLEHMAFKGTKKRPKALMISSAIDAVGGEFNAFTSKELTGYYIKLAAKHTKLSFDLLSDIIKNSVFAPVEIEREKGVIIEEINLYEDTPIQYVLNLFVRLLYGDNPMGRFIYGQKETVKGIKREDFLDYINRLYFPSNMVVAVAGKLDQLKIEKLTRLYFKSFKRKGKKVSEKIKTDQKKARVDLFYKKTEQAHFCLGVPGYSYSHPDRFVLGVLVAILGAGASSRLFTQIREKRGLAYYVGATPEFFTDSGYLLARAGVKLDKVEEAIKLTRAEFEKLKGKKVGETELKKGKEFLKGRMILALEDSHAVASRYAGQVLLEKKVRTPEETMGLIDRVTANDIRRVAKDIFSSEKLNLALIGPYEEKLRFRRLLE